MDLSQEMEKKISKCRIDYLDSLEERYRDCTDDDVVDLENGIVISGKDKTIMYEYTGKKFASLSTYRCQEAQDLYLEMKKKLLKSKKKEKKPLKSKQKKTSKYPERRKIKPKKYVLQKDEYTTSKSKVANPSRIIFRNNSTLTVDSLSLSKIENYGLGGTEDSDVESLQSFGATEDSDPESLQSLLSPMSNNPMKRCMFSTSCDKHLALEISLDDSKKHNNKKGEHHVLKVTADSEPESWENFSPNMGKSSKKRLFFLAGYSKKNLYEYMLEEKTFSSKNMLQCGKNKNVLQSNTSEISHGYTKKCSYKKGEHQGLKAAEDSDPETYENFSPRMRKPSKKRFLFSTNRNKENLYKDMPEEKTFCSENVLQNGKNRYAFKILLGDTKKRNNKKSEHQGLKATEDSEPESFKKFSPHMRKSTKKRHLFSTDRHEGNVYKDMPADKTSSNENVLQSGKSRYALQSNASKISLGDAKKCNNKKGEHQGLKTTEDSETEYFEKFSPRMRMSSKKRDLFSTDINEENLYKDMSAEKKFSSENVLQSGKKHSYAAFQNNALEILLSDTNKRNNKKGEHQGLKTTEDLEPGSFEKFSPRMRMFSKKRDLFSIDRNEENLNKDMPAEKKFSSEKVLQSGKKHNYAAFQSNALEISHGDTKIRSIKKGKLGNGQAMFIPVCSKSAPKISKRNGVYFDPKNSPLLRGASIDSLCLTPKSIKGKKRVLPDQFMALSPLKKKAPV